MDPHVGKQDPMTFWTNGDGSREKLPKQEHKAAFIFSLHQDVVYPPGAGTENTNLYLEVKK